jgi:tetratricopeptide (TPR) repeat protein
MHVHVRRAATALLCSLTVGSVAQAQGTPAPAVPAVKECNPNQVPTQALAQATFSMQRAFSSVQAKKDATADLKTAIKLLTSPPNKKDKDVNDSTGRAYYLAQAYILLLQQPGVRPVGRRLDYGIASDSLLTVDLLAAADTAIGTVETRWPECAAEIGKWRQQKPWIDALNGSINALNAGKMDSAEVLAKRSLLIEREAPYAYSVLASVYNSRKDYGNATEMLRKALDLASKDSAYNDAKLNALYDLATTATARAETAPQAEQKQRIAEAIAAWQAFIPMGTRDIQVANAQQTIVRLLKSTGDSTNLAQAYSAVIANPSHYGEQTLLNAGFIANRAKKNDDAIKLFSMVVDQNPYSRDGLFNLAASYIISNQYQKAFPLVDKLLSLDPNVPANWQLYTYAYSGLVKGAGKDPKLVKAYTDSLVKYDTRSQKLTAVVTLNEFSHGQSSTTLGGTIENRSTTPKTYNVEVEFLDKTGKVVATQTVSVGPVLPKSSAPFSATAQVGDAVAFRYKPLS